MSLFTWEMYLMTIFIYRFLSDSIHNLAEIAAGARLPHPFERMWQVSLSLSIIILGTCKIFSVFLILIAYQHQYTKNTIAWGFLPYSRPLFMTFGKFIRHTIKYLHKFKYLLGHSQYR